MQIADILCILDEWEKTRQKWLECFNENEGLKSLLKQYEHDLSKGRQEQREIRSQLIEARSQIAALVAGKQAIEHEKEQMVRIILFVFIIIFSVIYHFNIFS